MILCLVSLQTLLIAQSYTTAEGLVYATTGDAVTITGYNGTNKTVVVPALITNLPVVSLANNAFYRCTNITSVTLGTNVGSIGDFAFYACAALTNVVIPNSVTNIGAGAFRSCTYLATVSLPSGLRSIQDGTFYWCGLRNLVLPNGVTNIGNAAFAGSFLTNLTIPNGVLSIGDGAFNYCNNLTNIVIPDSVLSIGRGAFIYSWNLTAVILGSGVTNIGSEPFRLDLRLQTITVDTNNSAYSSINGVLFDKAQSALVAFPGGVTGSYTIPNSVTSLLDYAFSDCKLSSLSIPNSVTKTGSNVFWNCKSLTNITVGSQNPAFSALGGVLFDANRSTIVVYPGGLAGPYAIPNGVTRIGDCAFRAGSFSGITIPNSVTTIESSAFAFCSITNVAIPASVTNIMKEAFAGGVLSSIGVDPANAFYCSAGGVLFDKTQSTLVECPAKLSGSYTVTNTVRCIADSAFAYCSSLTNITIPNSVTNIGRSAFASSGLASILIPNSVVSIGAGAFSSCSSLTNVVVPDSVPVILPETFAYCSKLASISIPGSITEIGSSAFYGTALESLIIPRSVLHIAAYAFGGCSRLSRVYFAGDAPNMDAKTFWGDNVVILFLPGTIGWESDFAGARTDWWTLPYPAILSSEAGCGMLSNQFGFTISWATNVSVVVEAATNPAGAPWIPIYTATLSNGVHRFSDDQVGNYSKRFYRLRSL